MLGCVRADEVNSIKQDLSTINHSISLQKPSIKSKLAVSITCLDRQNLSTLLDVFRLDFEDLNREYLFHIH